MSPGITSSSPRATMARRADASTAPSSATATDEYPWEREGIDTKYPYVVHAELNAILNAHGRDLHGSRLYVALFPCNECAKAIIQSGVKEVLYLSDKYADSMATLASKRMMASAGVKFTQLRPRLKEITLDFVPEEERK